MLAFAINWIAVVAGVSQTMPTAAASWPQNHACRASDSVAGIRRKSSFAQPGWRKSGRGSTQPGVRWNTLTFAAVLTSSGMICTALAPVPITATRFPVMS